MCETNNKYEYIDLDYKYTDKETGVLRNLFGIKNITDLQEIEQRITTNKVRIIKRNPFLIEDMSSIQRIHHFLFEEIYSWAGQLREVEISKQDRDFLPTPRFDEGIKYINDLISGYKKINKESKSEIAKKLAHILHSLNNFHPFREGNGRTQRLALFLLAKEKDYFLDLNPPDDPMTYKQYMEGTVYGNKEILSELIEKSLKNFVEP
jgi:cell filamentation protein